VTEVTRGRTETAGNTADVDDARANHSRPGLQADLRAVPDRVLLPV
jgi:hypothetical protein